jgi:hypothetical protein
MKWMTSVHAIKDTLVSACRFLRRVLAESLLQQRAQTQALTTLIKQQDALLKELQALTASQRRLDGRLDRAELWLARNDTSYPLSQATMPDLAELRARGVEPPSDGKE